MRVRAMADASVSRRALLGAGAAWAAACGVPGLAALLDPALHYSAEEWRDAGESGALVEGVPLRVTYEIAAGWEQRREAAFVLRRGETLVAFSARCTHLGCLVRSTDGGFSCPCHGGAFDGGGRPLSGPVDKPLRRLEARLEGGRLLLRV